MSLSAIDIAIIGIYAVSIFILAQWVSREKGTHQKDAQDYFLASRALPWWAIGTSLIAANISAEQIIGMSDCTRFGGSQLTSADEGIHCSAGRAAVLRIAACAFGGGPLNPPHRT